MSKSIELTQSQIKALKSGATMFIFPISDYDLNRIDKGYSIGDSFPINKGDKDILIKPLLCTCNAGVNNTSGKCISCGTFIDYPMTQYNYSFSECIDVIVIKVKDIKMKEWQKIGTCLFDSKDFYNQQLKEQKINRTYEDNDYVFLAEFA